MKKTYEKPVADKIEFDYKEQIVTSSNCEETWTWIKVDGSKCTDKSVSYTN